MLGRFRRSAESKILRLEHQRVPESVLAAGSEERSAGDIVEAVENEEAILGIALGFESAATPNVDGSDAALKACDKIRRAAAGGVIDKPVFAVDAGIGRPAA